MSTLPGIRLASAALAIPAKARITEVTNHCALCSEAPSAPLFQVDGSLVMSCRGCGLIRQDTRPLTASELYDSDYYATDDPKGGYANYFLDADVNRRTFRRRMKSIERRYGRRGKLLDVGCALGDFLLEAKNSGWDVEGVEISAFAAQRAREQGLRVRTGRLETLGLPQASYDVITLYDAIEHMSDPVATLAAVRRLLKPGGLLHLVTPNVGGIQARVLGRHWYHYKPGEHLFYFAPNTLRDTVERAGLQWKGWSRSASYLTFTYVFSRLRYYAAAPFGLLEWLGRTFRFGPCTFRVDVGEMEAWAVRET